MNPSKLRILCVDDDPNDRMILSHSLEQNLGLDHDLIMAPTGQEALQRFDEDNVDLVILDHKLPGMTGLELLEQFQKRKMLTAIIFLTGTGSERVAIEAMKRGARNYLIKEDVIINPKLLVDAIKGLVGPSLRMEERVALDKRLSVAPVRKPGQVIQEFKDKISTFDSSWLVAFTLSPEKYASLTTEVLRLLANEMNLKVVYVTTNNPYSSLKESLSSKGIKVENVFFIDAVSEDAGLRGSKAEDCKFIESSSSLTELGIELQSAVSRYKSDSSPPLIVLDSVSTLLVHNSEQSVGKFIHYTAARIRIWKGRGVFLSIQDEASKEVVKTLQQYCDETIAVT